jgi:hypothetical protein
MLLSFPALITKNSGHLETRSVNRLAKDRAGALTGVYFSLKRKDLVNNL